MAMAGGEVFVLVLVLVLVHVEEVEESNRPQSWCCTASHIAPATLPNHANSSASPPFLDPQILSYTEYLLASSFTVLSLKPPLKHAGNHVAHLRVLSLSPPPHPSPLTNPHLTLPRFSLALCPRIDHSNCRSRRIFPCPASCTQCAQVT
jgi:hypothetical protein